MNWFLIALVPPIFFAVANHADKFLLSDRARGARIGPIIIFSALFSVAALPIVAAAQFKILDLSVGQASALVGVGISGVVAVLLYLYALATDEASLVIPFYQTVPFFAYAVGYLVLGETVTVSQGLGSVVIIIGATALSLRFGGEQVRFKGKLVGLMLAASLLNAVNGVVFKLVALDRGFWLSLWWSLVGQCMAGLILFICVAPYRRDFLKFLQQRKLGALGLIAASEALFSVGEAITLYATLLAPVALVLLVNSFQPLFVLVLGILLTIFLPDVEHESLRPASILQKVAAIGLMMFGAYLIDT